MVNNGITTAVNNEYTLTGVVDGITVNLASFSLRSGGETILTLTALVDADTENEIVAFTGSCSSKSTSVQFTILSPAGVSGDPHFEQFILDEKFNVTKRICYDVIGKSNDIIEIFREPKKKINILGQLKNDYYLHKIIINVYFNQIKATIDHIIISPLFKRTWNELTENIFMDFSNFRIIFKKRKQTETLFIDLHGKQSFAIQRKKNELENFFLNVIIFGLTTDYIGKYGLIGRIGNNNITIYPKIQDIDKTTVYINGIETVGYIKKRNGKICYLIDVNDLLYPFNIKNYIIR